MKLEPDVNKESSVDKKLMTVQEAASRLALSRSKVYLLIASAELPTVTIGRSRRITERALNAYVTSLEEQAGTGDARR